MPIQYTPDPYGQALYKSLSQQANPYHDQPQGIDLGSRWWNRGKPPNEWTPYPPQDFPVPGQPPVGPVWSPQQSGLNSALQGGEPPSPTPAPPAPATPPPGWQQTFPERTRGKPVPPDFDITEDFLKTRVVPDTTQPPVFYETPTTPTGEIPPAGTKSMAVGEPLTAAAGPTGGTGAGTYRSQLRGFDLGKFGSTSIKYQAAAVFENFAPTPENLPAVVTELKKRGLNATQVGKDSIDFNDGFGPIDVIYAAGEGGKGWQWEPHSGREGGGGAQAAVPPSNVAGTLQPNISTSQQDYARAVLQYLLQQLGLNNALTGGR